MLTPFAHRTMSEELLKRMRALRERAETLSRTLVEDYSPFRSGFDRTTFFRLPTNPSKNEDDVGVTPTCTAFMALALSNSCGAFYHPKSQHDLPDAVKRRLSPSEIKQRIASGLSRNDLTVLLKSGLQTLLRAKWETGDLDPNNAFTTALVLRSAGMLHKKGLLSGAVLTSLKRGKADYSAAREYQRFKGKTLWKIIQSIATDVPESLRVQHYPASPTIGFWFVDAISLLGAKLNQRASKAVVGWATTEFARQISLVVANHHAMMDPVGMAMAACLCRLLRRIMTAPGCLLKGDVSNLPSESELRAAIDLFFRAQNKAGVWEKYFPLFHYPGAGPNHCWHFEVLEAVLQEFPDTVCDGGLLEKVANSVRWLEANRLRWRGETGQLFRGWNAGGDIKSLREGQPESWPTGVAHMFLWRLRNALSIEIQELVLKKYGDRVQRFAKANRSRWDSYLDSSLSAFNPPRDTVKKLVETEILEPTENAVTEYVGSFKDGDTKTIGPDFQLRARRSALLFGPPGTSKTSFAESVALRLGWWFLELSPSDFLKEGLEGIYERVNEVFQDLMDLFGVVILFDEMDALVQSREGGEEPVSGKRMEVPQLDVTQKFLTTSMLPKLLKLRKRGRTVFFMATNHQKDFDPAIKRSGRFDLLIHMGPPCLTEKLDGLQQWYHDSESQTDRDQIRKLLRGWTKSKPIRDAIELFTFGEMDAFFEYIRRQDEANQNLRVGLEKLTKDGFEAQVHKWSEEQIVLRKGSPAYREFKEDECASRIQ